MDMADLKTEVRDFWDAASCGEVYAEGLSAKQRFRKHAEARYRLEPYIRGFARFEEGSGQDVLEIGVGIDKKVRANVVPARSRRVRG